MRELLVGITRPTPNAQRPTPNAIGNLHFHFTRDAHDDLTIQHTAGRDFTALSQSIHYLPASVNTFFLVAAFYLRGYSISHEECSGLLQLSRQRLSFVLRRRTSSAKKMADPNFTVGTGHARSYEAPGMGWVMDLSEHSHPWSCPTPAGGCRSGHSNSRWLCRRRSSACRSSKRTCHRSPRRLSHTRR